MSWARSSKRFRPTASTPTWPSIGQAISRSSRSVPSLWRRLMEFREHVLPNGLEVVAECNDEARSTALGFFVKTGARDETDDVSGVSHFLEHMVFKGTPSRSAEDVNREFDDMGADYNAYTSVEVTAYHAIVLPEFQTATVELLADILRP